MRKLVSKTELDFESLVAHGRLATMADGDFEDEQAAERHVVIRVEPLIGRERTQPTMNAGTELQVQIEIAFDQQTWMGYV
jgi:hypothetical protein